MPTAHSNCRGDALFQRIASFFSHADEYRNRQTPLRAVRPGPATPKVEILPLIHLTAFTAIGQGVLTGWLPGYLLLTGAIG